MSIHHWRIVADLFGVVYRAGGCEVLGIITYCDKQPLEENRYIEIELRYDSLFMQVTICTVIRDFECVQFRSSLNVDGDQFLLCDETNAVEKFKEFFGGNENE